MLVESNACRYTHHRYPNASNVLRHPTCAEVFAAILAMHGWGHVLGKFNNLLLRMSNGEQQISGTTTRYRSGLYATLPVDLAESVKIGGLKADMHESCRL